MQKLKFKATQSLDYVLCSSNMSHQDVGIPQLDTVHTSSSHTVLLTSCVRRLRYNLNILQRNVSLTLLTYVVVTMHDSSLLLDNH